MDDPHALNKYLGCFHHFLETTANGEKMMTIQFDMADYFKSAREIFIAETGETLKSASTPFAPEINSEDLDHLLNTPGKFSSRAASFIMKLMCGARMAMPQICVIVSRLASQITKWSADSDRRLLRMYGYLRANADKVLTGTLANSDRKHLKIIAWPDADLNGDFVELAGREGGFPLGLGLPQAGIDGDAHRGGRDRDPRARLQTRAHPLSDPPPGQAWGASGLHREGGQRGLHHRCDEGLLAEPATPEEDAAHRTGTSP